MGRNSLIRKGARLKKKVKKTAKKPEKPKYTCRWCGKEKDETHFFKCAITHGSYICKDCIKRKYNEVNEKCEKYIAILICSHYLDIAFYYDVYQSLGIGEGLGYYIRQLNLIQNQNPDTFAEGIIKNNNIIDYTPKDLKIEKAKSELTEIIDKLEAIKNDL